MSANLFNATSCCQQLVSKSVIQCQWVCFCFILLLTSSATLLPYKVLTLHPVSDGTNIFFYCRIKIFHELFFFCLYSDILIMWSWVLYDLNWIKENFDGPASFLLYLLPLSVSWMWAFVFRTWPCLKYSYLISTERLKECVWWGNPGCPGASRT